MEQKDATESMWRSFGKLYEAAVYRNQRMPGSELYSFEDGTGEAGHRRFIVSEGTHFREVYLGLGATERHHYELIGEGRPCHIYADLEYQMEGNMVQNGGDLIEQLITVLDVQLKKDFEVSAWGGTITELDSSTDEKFSRHIHIVPAPPACFRNNVQMGDYLKKIWDKEEFRVWKRKESEWESVSFIDWSVYRRNSNMRLAYSTKLGKRVWLVPTGRFCHQKTVPQDILSRCLICPTDLRGYRILFWRKREREGKRLIIQRSEGGKGGRSGRNSSFPELDRYIKVYLAALTPPGSIERSIYYRESQTVVYSVRENRYCGNIREEHKTNCVMLVVDLHRGVLYQKCLNERCRSYRSEAQGVPIMFWRVAP